MKAEDENGGKKDVFRWGFKSAMEFEWRTKEEALQNAVGIKWKLVSLCRVVGEDRGTSFRWLEKGVIHRSLKRPSVLCSMWWSAGWISPLGGCYRACGAKEQEEFLTFPKCCGDRMRFSLLSIRWWHWSLLFLWSGCNWCIFCWELVLSVQGVWRFDRCVFPPTEGAPHWCQGTLPPLAGSFSW